MSCLDVMYQVYGPPQPYFAAAYTPYHQVRVSSRSGRVDRWRAPATQVLPVLRGSRYLRAGPREADQLQMRGLPALPPNRLS